jgi:hypothetical protein
MVSETAQEQGYGIGTSLSPLTLFVMFLFVAILAILVDTLLDAAEEYSKGTAYQAMSQRIYREIMVMGFTSFLIGTIQACGISLDQKWSNSYYFSDQLTFLAAVFFAFHGFIIMIISIRFSKSWERAEKIKFAELLQDVEHARQKDIFWYHRWQPFFCPTRDQLEFRMFRVLFSSTYHIGGNITNFDFGLYLRLSHENYLLTMINLHPWKWCLMLLLTAIVSLKRYIFDLDEYCDYDVSCISRIDTMLFTIGGCLQLITVIVLVYIGKRSEHILLNKIGVRDITDYDIFLMKEKEIYNIIGERILDKATILDTISTLRYEKQVKYFNKKGLSMKKDNNNHNNNNQSFSSFGSRRSNMFLKLSSFLKGSFDEDSNSPFESRSGSFGRSGSFHSNEPESPSHSRTFSNRSMSNPTKIQSTASPDGVVTTTGSNEFGSTELSVVNEGENDDDAVVVVDTDDVMACDRMLIIECDNEEGKTSRRLSYSSSSSDSDSHSDNMDNKVDGVMSADERKGSERSLTTTKSWKKSLSNRAMAAKPDTNTASTPPLKAMKKVLSMKKAVSVRKTSPNPDAITSINAVSSRKGQLMAPPKVRQKLAEEKSSVFDDMPGDGTVISKPTNARMQTFDSGLSNAESTFGEVNSSFQSKHTGTESFCSSATFRKEAIQKLKMILDQGFSEDGKDVHKINFRDIFLWNAPDLFYYAIDIVIVTNSFYMAWWVTTICITAATTGIVLESVAWEIVSVLPTILTFMYLSLVLKTSTILKSLTELNLDIVTSVFKRTEVTNQHMQVLRDDLLYRMTRLSTESSDKKASIKDLFTAIDDDGIGDISAEDFRRMLIKLHLFIEKSIRVAMFAAIDLNHNGLISFEVMK